LNTLPKGTVYAFVDGAFIDGTCGCGVVFVLRQNGMVTTRELSLTAAEAAGMAGLDGTLDVQAESVRLRNVLGELLAFLAALSHVRPGTSLVVVHDYEGIAAWFRGEWRARDHLVRRLVSAAHRMVLEKAMAVEFRHRRSQGDGESAAYIRTADRLASMAARRAAHR
jgi:hypothetical protein